MGKTIDNMPDYRARMEGRPTLDEAIRGPSCSSPSACSVRVPAHNLKTTDFPACASRCALVEAMGVGECEAACPWKFDSDGNPVAQNGPHHRAE